MKKLALLFAAAIMAVSVSAQTVTESKTFDNFYIGIDGELLHGSRFEIENLPRSLRFIVPL
jgi:diacylglycerol kinase family enzyme